MSLQQAGHPILRNGLIFGAILGVLGAGNILIQWAAGAYHVVAQTTNGISSVNVNSTGGTSLLGCVVFLAMLALTFAAGILASKSTGKVGTGSLAGLLTGVFGGLIGGIGNVLIMAVLVVPGLEIPAGVSLSSSQIQLLAIGIAAFAAVLGLLLDTGIGAGMGALGGLIGASNARKAMPQMPPAPAPYTPGYPGNQWYPTAPTYPGTPQPGAAPQAWPYPNQPQPPQYPQYPPQPGNPQYPQYPPQ
ncbi:MAG: hypothetical protein ACM3N4_10680 [Nitrososphaerota archaeon]